MTATYAVGDDITYAGELPCDEATHSGTVTAVEPDASGDSVVTVKFGCGATAGLTQDILASELRPA